MATKKEEKKDPVEEKKDPVNVMSGVADLLGLATTIGTAVPGLRKPKKSESAANAATAGANQVMRAAVSAGQAQLGRSASGLMSGLRTASQAASDSAMARGRAADMDQNRYEGRKDARNANLAQFGKDIGGMVAATTGELANQTQARRADKADEAAAAAGAQAGQAVTEQDHYAKAMGALTGYPSMAGQQGNVVSQTPQEQAGQFPGMVSQTPQQMAGDPALAGPQSNVVSQTPQEQQQEVDTRQAQRQTMAPIMEPLQDPVLAHLGLPQLQELWSISPQLENQLRMESYLADESNRLAIPTTSIYARVKRMQNLPQTWDMMGGTGPREDY